MVENYLPPPPPPSTRSRGFFSGEILALPLNSAIAERGVRLGTSSETCGRLCFSTHRFTACSLFGKWASPSLPYQNLALLPTHSRICPAVYVVCSIFELLSREKILLYDAIRTFFCIVRKVRTPWKLSGCHTAQRARVTFAFLGFSAWS